ncbi:copper resistance protein B [Pseudohongiella acticola]|nr:copper resistance protein B [Pseudohongiella acticola]
MIRPVKSKTCIAMVLGLGAAATANAQQVETAPGGIDVHAHAVEHAPDIFRSVMIDQLELRHGDDGSPLILEGEAWIGSDLNKFWMKADIDSLDGDVEEFELQALYSRAVAPYWDLQMGLRQDIRPDDGRSWAVLGLQGLAPYFFETEAALFISKSGGAAMSLSTEYELLLTQQWVLSPEIELDFYGQNDRARGTGSGLSDIQAGIRLRYEVRREFAPYIGINWNRKFGDAAEFAADAGEDASSTQWVAGFRIWF